MTEDELINPGSGRGPARLAVTGVTQPPPAAASTENRAGESLGPAEGRDVRRFWAAYAVSALGSGVGSGALPLVAVLVVHASDWQVSLLAVLGGLAGVAVAVPLGPFVEFHRKLPAMIAADLIRFVALASVPAAAWLGILDYALLCAVAVVQTAATIVSNAASNPYLKTLVPAPDRARVNGRLESTTWTASALGPPVGGLLVSATSPVASLLIDAVSYLAAALGWTRIRYREAAPPAPEHRRWLADTVAGWHYILAHPILKRLFGNALLFGGLIMASSPLIAVYLLRDLGFSALEYGIALGAPCAAGTLGSLLAPMVIRRAGLGRTLLYTGAARCLWMAPILLAPPTTAGLVLIIAADSTLLLFAGIFNPAFATYRMNAVADTHLSRVVGAWAMTSKLVQPVCIAAAGLLAAATSLRTAIAVLAALLLACAVLLPWTALHRRPAPSAGTGCEGDFLR
ncbi:MFS transporter [Actinoplanes sp. NBRC 103695]|uniref:MFS transporter n=1 Tax=Actinoplanes sp. NBRC 103695 TaxID=3032202 RepID=UPI0024A09EBE|nr:MFS transporter [Actinoplanes sp. NBRC 103695]GLY99813.1 MFS transporter [Actinoplanes sp. NBRC 103695]